MSFRVIISSAPLLLILISFSHRATRAAHISGGEDKLANLEDQSKQPANNSRITPATRINQVLAQGVNSRPVNGPAASAQQQQQQQQRAASNLLAARQHWRQMEKSLGTSMESAAESLRSQLGEILSRQQNNNSSSSASGGGVSSGCRMALNEVLDKLRDNSLWAAQMLDSSAKLPSGLLDGTLTEMGNFDGCLAVRSPSVQGQYCTISVRPHLVPRPRLHTACQRLPALSGADTGARNMSLFRWMSRNSHQFYYASLRLGVCTPHRCSRTDLQQMLNVLMAKYDLIGQVKSCQTAPLLSSAGNYLDDHFDSTQQIIIFVLLALVGCSLIGTLLDCAQSKPTEKKETSFQMQQQQQQPQPRRWQRYQVYQRNKCNECNHSAIANSLLWAATANQQTKEDPLLLACPQTAATTPRQAEMDYGGAGVGEDDDEEKDESWIVKLEQQQEAPPLPVGVTDSENNQRKRLLQVLAQVLGCFSLRQNLKTIGKQVPSAQASTGSSSTGTTDDIKVIHGLRTLTMIWIIFGHTIGLVNPEMMNNLFALAQLSCSSRFLQALLNATLAVNTFFMISGVVTMISLGRRCRSASNLVTTTTSPATAATTTAASTTTAADYVKEGKKEEDSISVASSSQSSGASSNRRCIHLKDKMQTTTETVDRNFLGLPKDFKPILWLLMRYLRLTPTYATVIGLSIVMPALGDGPFWSETAGQLGVACRANWRLNLAYANNLLETDKLCLIHSWYLSNDWQFFVLTLCLLALAYRSKRLALLVAISLGLASMAATFAVTVVNEFPPTIVTTSPAVAERWQFIHQLYYKPWPHLNSYLIGLLVGYFIIHTRPSSSETKAGSWRLRCVSLFMGCLACLLLSSIHPWNVGQRVEPILAGVHSATFRTLWATCCGWLLLTLVQRPHLLLAKFLAWPGFQLTSRLTYCTYLSQPLVIYYHFGTLRERLDSSMYSQFARFVATLGLSYLAALVLALLVESPSIRLQQLLASSNESRRPVQTVDCKQPKRRQRLDESLCSQSSAESAVTSTTTDSWLMSQPAAAATAATMREPLPPPPPPPQPPATTALDAEFQRKLAQAIGRGFRIRSRMAAASKCSASRMSISSAAAAARQRQPIVSVEPTSVGLIQNPLQKLGQSLEPMRRMRDLSSCDSLQTFCKQPADTSRRSSSDEPIKQQSASGNNCSLNDLIQMRRKFLSTQRSQPSKNI